MANDITATVWEFVTERFPKRDSRREVSEITRMCKKIGRLGFSETLSEITLTRRNEVAASGSSHYTMGFSC